MVSFKHMFEEVNHIDPHKPAYPPLDRAAFLIEHACVPKSYPSFCAETAQLFALMEAARRGNTPKITNEVSQTEH